ncbi:hypothetical protein EBZ80_11115 [bacterium]|nr:hypothetical protein [bacterium]
MKYPNDTSRPCAENPRGMLFLRAFPLVAGVVLFFSLAPVGVALDVGPSPPSPAEVLEQSAGGPAEMIRVISSLEPAIAEIPDKNTLYGYLLTLPELRRLAERYDFHSFGTSPVDPLAARLTRAAAKWINLLEDNQEVIDVFLRFANDQTRYSVGEEQTAHVIVEKDVAKLLKWNKKARAALLTLRGMKAQVYVTESYERIQGVVVAQVFGQMMTLGAAQVEELIANLDSRSAVDELIGKTATILAAAKTDVEINRLLEIAVGLNKQAVVLNVGGNRVVADAISGPAASFCAEILVRIASMGIVPDLTFARRIPDALGAIQAATVAGRIAGLKFALIQESQAAFFFDLVNALIARCEALGLRQEAAALAPAIAQLTPLLVFSPAAFEGTYDARIGSQSGKLTLLESGNGELMLAFNVDAAEVRHDAEPAGSTGARIISFSIFSITFNKERKTFEGAYRTPRGSLFTFGGSSNTLVQFSLRSAGGKSVISGRVSTGGGTWSNFEGVRVEVPAAPGPDAEVVAEPAGTYRCVSEDTVCALDMVNLSPFISGNLMIDDRYLTLQLPYGFYDTKRKLLFLNTTELGSGMFAQLRGWFTQGGKYFHASYVVGGIGNARELKMERVDDTSSSHQASRGARAGGMLRLARDTSRGQF